MRPLRLLLTAALLLGAACDDNRYPDKAVPFSRESLDGHRIALPQDTDGKVVVLHFWTGATPGGTSQLAALEALWQAGKTREMVLLAVNVGESREIASTALAGRAITYPVALDLASALAHAYGVTTTPATVLVDREGHVRMRIPGTVPFGVVRSALETLL